MQAPDRRGNGGRTCAANQCIHFPAHGEKGCVCEVAVSAHPPGPQSVWLWCFRAAACSMLGECSVYLIMLQPYLFVFLIVRCLWLAFVARLILLVGVQMLMSCN